MPSERNRQRLKAMGKDRGEKASVPQKHVVGKIYEESLLIMKRRQFLVYTFLRDVVKKCPVSNERIKEIRDTMYMLQEKHRNTAQLLPYADLCMSTNRITIPENLYPSEIVALSFQILARFVGKNKTDKYQLTIWDVV